MGRAHAALIAALLLFASGSDASEGASRAHGTLSIHAYLWQRRYDSAVGDALRQAAGEIDRVILLAAEIAYRDGRRRVHQVAIDEAAIGGAPVGLAIRVGPWRGTDHRAEGERLAELAADMLARERAAGLRVEELQIDHDAPTAGLAQYAAWLELLHERLPADVALTVTALPAWLDSPDLPAVLAETDGYVLQVHSLEAPRRRRDVPPLCDPLAARAAVERAARFGVPFRVALPSYGYELAFAGDGRFLGLGAEQDLPELPPDAHTDIVMADADAMAALTRGWTADRPRELTGIAWFRLPVAGDRLSWSWPTLRAAMHGQNTRADLVVEVVETETPGLAHVVVRNRGTASAHAAARIETEAGEVILTADGSSGYALEGFEARRAIFSSGDPPEVDAGEEVLVGWMRHDAHL